MREPLLTEIRDEIAALRSVLITLLASLLRHAPSVGNDPQVVELARELRLQAQRLHASTQRMRLRRRDEEPEP
jgi:hypothetical protein